MRKVFSLIILCVLFAGCNFPLIQTQIPPDAVAVTGNLTAVSSGASGYFGLTPTSPGTVPGTSTLNFPASDIGQMR